MSDQHYTKVKRGIVVNGHECIIEECYEGTAIWRRLVKRIAKRGNRFVDIVDEEGANNWLTLGRTTAEPPADRFNPYDYPPEQCL